MKSLAIGTLLIAIFTCVSCGEAPSQAPMPSPHANRLDTQKALETPVFQLIADSTKESKFLRVRGDQFVDAEGRQVLLHGLSMISKSKAENYLSWHHADDFANMRAWGMNCIRLGILWDGIEPQPGEYDEAYLDGVAQRVEWASEHGLYVFLDMHQDLFSALYSDGAPAWATLHEEMAHNTGEIWSDSYLISPAVQTAFDNFWANAPASDGVGIQDHYAAAWRHVAKRFADNPTVLGYDLMNEPFEGTSVVSAQVALLQSDFGKMLTERLGDLIQSPIEILALWQQPEGRQAIMQHLEDLELYESFVDSREKMSQAFEQKHLQPMYQKVANAIRTVDQDHILLLETSYHCNAGVRSGIESVTGPNGQRDAQQAYAPHAYDIVVDTPALANANTERVEMIFRRHDDTAQRLKMPMIIGEWGALGNADERIVPSARILQIQLERLLCSDTYWDYSRAIDKQSYFNVLKRSIPCRIAGRLLEYKSTPKTNDFVCRWKETKVVTAPTIIYLTQATFEGRELRLEPKGEGLKVQLVSGGSGDVYVSITPIGTAVERFFTVE